MLRAIRTITTLAALALALPGCPNGDDPPQDFVIRLALDNEADGTCPSTMSCSDFPIGCPIKVGVRLLGLPDPDGADAGPPRVKPFCGRTRKQADELQDLCDLGDQTVLDIRFDPLRPERGQVEFLVWRDLDPEADPVVCPPVEFDFAGRPIIDGDDPNPPAFGRRVFFDFGAEPVARVPLACTEPARIDAPECTPPTTNFRVDVDDLDNLAVGIPAERARFLSVSVGQPVTSNGTDYELVPEDFVALRRVQDTPEIRPYWEEKDVLTSYELHSDICAIVLDFGGVPAVTCSTVEVAGSIELLARMVAHEDWDTIRTAIDLNVFPADGLILGRVVDTNMNPLDGAVVTPSEAPTAFYYLNADKTSYTDGGGAPLTETSSSGYFVARGPSFKSTWTAVRGSGWREVGAPTGGALRQSLTVMLIIMNQDLMPP